MRNTVLFVNHAVVDSRVVGGQMTQQGVGNPQVASMFSKSIGFTLCGMAEEPTSPALILFKVIHRDVGQNRDSNPKRLY